MGSIKGDIFKAIGDLLMIAMASDDETIMPSLKWYDKDFGQAELIKQGIISLPLPAVLIKITCPIWDGRLSNVQTGEGLIRIRVLFENYADSFQTNEGDSINQGKAIQFFEFNEKINIALDGVQGENFTSLNRSGDDEDDDHDMIIVTDVTYTTLITDDKAQNKGMSVIENPVINSTQEHSITKPEIITDHYFVIPKKQ